jgi:hypothetical protein
MDEMTAKIDQVFMSDTIGALALALSKAQGAMGGAKKGATNPHLKNKYADLASVMDAVKEPLSSNELAISQLIENEGESVAVRTLLIHSSGEWLMSRVVLAASGNKGVNEAQAMGSTISYLRRYSASGITGLHQEDDDAASAGKGKAEQKAQAESRAKGFAEDIKKIDNIPHLNNWWTKHEAEVTNLPEALCKKVKATWHMVKGEIEGKLKADKANESAGDTEALEADAARGDGREPGQEG